jgi:hypothetical protein
MLELRSTCENCNQQWSPISLEARICTFCDRDESNRTAKR